MLPLFPPKNNPLCVSHTANRVVIARVVATIEGNAVGIGWVTNLIVRQASAAGAVHLAWIAMAALTVYWAADA